MDTNESVESSSIIEPTKEVGCDEKSSKEIAESEVVSDLLSSSNTVSLPLPEAHGDVQLVDTIEVKDNVLTPSDVKVDSSDNIIKVVEKGEEISFGESKSSSIILTDTSNTNQLIPNSSEIITSTESSDIEIINFYDVGNLEPNTGTVSQLDMGSDTNNNLDLINSTNSNSNLGVDILAMDNFDLNDNSNVITCSDIIDEADKTNSVIPLDEMSVDENVLMLESDSSPENDIIENTIHSSSNVVSNIDNVMSVDEVEMSISNIPMPDNPIYGTEIDISSSFMSDAQANVVFELDQVSQNLVSESNVIESMEAESKNFTTVSLDFDSLAETSTDIQSSVIEPQMLSSVSLDSVEVSLVSENLPSEELAGTVSFDTINSGNDINILTGNPNVVISSENQPAETLLEFTEVESQTVVDDFNLSNTYGNLELNKPNSPVVLSEDKLPKMIQFDDEQNETSILDPDKNLNDVELVGKSSIEGKSLDTILQLDSEADSFLNTDSRHFSHSDPIMNDVITESHINSNSGPPDSSSAVEKVDNLTANNETDQPITTTHLKSTDIEISTANNSEVVDIVNQIIERPNTIIPDITEPDSTTNITEPSIYDVANVNPCATELSVSLNNDSTPKAELENFIPLDDLVSLPLEPDTRVLVFEPSPESLLQINPLLTVSPLPGPSVESPAMPACVPSSKLGIDVEPSQTLLSHNEPNKPSISSSSASVLSPPSCFEPLSSDDSKNIVPCVATVLEAKIPDETKPVLPPSRDQEISSGCEMPSLEETIDVNKVSSTSETDTGTLESETTGIKKLSTNKTFVSPLRTEEPSVSEGISVPVEVNVPVAKITELVSPITFVKPNEKPETTKTKISPVVQNEPPVAAEVTKVEPLPVPVVEEPSSETSPITIIEKPQRVIEKSPSFTEPIVDQPAGGDQPSLEQVTSEPVTEQFATESTTILKELDAQPKPSFEEIAVENKALTENVTTTNQPVIDQPITKTEPTIEEITVETQPVIGQVVGDDFPSVDEPNSENLTKLVVESVPVIVIPKPITEAVPVPLMEKPAISIPVIQTLPYSSLKTIAPTAIQIEKSQDSKVEVPLSATLKPKAEEQVLPQSQMQEKSRETTLQIPSISVVKHTSPSTIIQATVVSRQPSTDKAESPVPIITFKAMPINQQVAEPAKIIATIVPNIETVTRSPITVSKKPEVVAPTETKTPKVTTIHIKPIPEPVSESKPTEITIEVPTTSNLAVGKDTVPPITLSKSLMVKTHMSEPITSTRIIIRPITAPSSGETIKKLNIKPIIQPPTSPVKPEPIPRLIIKPVSSTRSVVESLPSKKSSEEPMSRIQLHVVPATSSKDSSTNQRFEITTTPAKIVTKETSLVASVPKVEPLTLKRLATDQGHTVVPSKIACTQPSSDTKTSKVTEPKPLDVFTIYTTNSPKSDPLVLTNVQSDETRQETTTSADVVNLDLEVIEEKEKLVPDAMDFEGDSFIDEASLNDASLGENEDFSFIKPKTADLVDEVAANNGTVPFIEEDTQSSWSLDPNKLSVAKLKDCIDPTAKVIDEESRDSVGSVSSKKSTKEARTTSHDASSVFEYQWPPEKGEFYILQEQLCEFLGVKSFKRKHPDLPRRNVDKEERVFLKEKNVVSETQCDLGLTALRSEDVMELMAKDYSDKYQEYIRAQQEKQRQAIAIKNKEYAAANLDKNKIRDLLKKAMKSASEYNAHLNQERRDERKMSFDLQTYTIHVPASKKRKLDAEATKVGKYPVALLAGQYQDYYRKYTPNELKYMPLNTVLYGPLQELSSINVPPGSDGSNSDSDGSDSEASCCSSSLGTQDGSGGDSSSESETTAAAKNDVYFKPKDVPSPCKICHGNHEQNKQSQPEELINCSQCKTSAHPSCLELPAELVSVIKTYEWQCMECKTCMLCMDPYDEEKMMFCDKCDRGFHTFCVGLKNLPSGRWICQLCGQCALCGSKTPGPEGTKLQWQQAAGEGNKKPQLLCVACSKKKAK